MDNRHFIAKKVASFFKDGDVINLGRPKDSHLYLILSLLYLIKFPNQSTIKIT